MLPGLCSLTDLATPSYTALAGISGGHSLNMENTIQDACPGTPKSQQGSFGHLPPSSREAPSSPTCSEATIKPHQTEPPAYMAPRYLDSPSLPYYDSSPTSPGVLHLPTPQQPPAADDPTSTNCFPNTTVPSHSSDEDDEDIPLAHLLLYTHLAPPPYSTVVQQSYRETLQQHLPGLSVHVDIDEEAAREQLRLDDISFKVERAVAMAVVIGLLMLTGLFVGLYFLRR